MGKLKKTDLNLQIEYLDPNELKPYKKNARKHAKYDIDEIIKSINDCGFSDPIGIWGKDNLIVEGHGRQLAAIQMGMTKVPCIRLDHMTDAERKEYAIRHNRTAELSEWDVEILKQEIADLQLDDIDLSDLNFDFLQDEDDLKENGEVIEDEPVDPPKEPVAKLGDIYLLGKNRLMCGDSTKAEDVYKLMDGNQADLLLTDPPYNVNYQGGTKDALKIMNDSMEDGAFRAFLTDAFVNADQVMNPGAAYYIWHADSEGLNFRCAVRNAGWTLRQTLIWVKNSLVLGRQDYQWKHEPCAIPGSMVWTPEGEKPIEELKDGDRVISFDPTQGVVKGYKEGYEVKTAHRHYSGKIYGVTSGNKQTWVTNNHRFTVKFNPDCANKWCTYIMVNNDGWWRVGCTRTYDARQFGLKGRIHTEKATAAWILDTHKNRADAQMMEQYISTKYGIPYTYWTVQEERGIHPSDTARSKENIEWLYKKLDLEEMRKKAEECLSDFGRSIDYPLITKETGASRFSRRATTKINACNIIPDLMMVPIPYRTYNGTRTFEWAAIDEVPTKDYDGDVYSLAVEKYEHYVQDGIITHNCLYGWKNGTHYFTDDRTETTVIDDKIDLKKLKKEEMLAMLQEIFSDKTPTTVIYEDKPLVNDIHPTMKPIRLMARLIRNSTRPGQKVLDIFGGSGSTMIACEQLERECFTMELDPRYVDAMIARWEKLTGRKAIKITD